MTTVREKHGNALPAKLPTYPAHSWRTLHSSSSRQPLRSAHATELRAEGEYCTGGGQGGPRLLNPILFSSTARPFSSAPSVSGYHAYRPLGVHSWKAAPRPALPEQLGKPRLPLGHPTYIPLAPSSNPVCVPPLPHPPHGTGLNKKSATLHPKRDLDDRLPASLHPPAKGIRPCIHCLYLLYIYSTLGSKKRRALHCMHVGSIYLLYRYPPKIAPKSAQK